MIDKVENILSQMTVEEKLGQLTEVRFTMERIDEIHELVKNGEVGSLILADDAFAGAHDREDIEIEVLNKIQKEAIENSRFGIPLVNGRDIIHGSRTIFPIPLAQMSTWDEKLIEDAAAIMAQEACYEGVHLTFAPMVDICNDPRWGRIIECPGEDPLLGSVFARASVRGIQGDDMSKSGKIAACAKHYIGYGASCAGRDKDPTEWSEYSIRNRALPAFKAAVDEGVAVVMTSFNEISGQPATASRYYITDVLKNELEFDGMVISDYDAITRLKQQGVSDSDEHSAVLAINAGVDMDMNDCLYKNHLVNALNKGLVSMSTIDEAVRRVLMLKFKLGLFDNPYIDNDAEKDKFMTPQYLEKAKEVSQHSMILLKNNGILPLPKGEKKIIVKGPYATEQRHLLGSWYGGGKPEEVISLSQGIAMVNGKEYTVTHNCTADEMGSYERSSDTYIIAIGEPGGVTGEGTTIPNIEFSVSQLECAKKAKEIGKKVIAVIFAGRPLAIKDLLPYCDAVLWAWHGGTMCGLAAAEIIFGDFNPCGKLPVTIPRYTGQIPTQYNSNPNEWGMKWYYNHSDYASRGAFDSTPLFEFGYGLSYTQFKYTDFKYEFNKEKKIVQISFDIENIGNCSGWEIAQCYIHDVVASSARPIKELKAFKKIYIQKGDKRSIVLELSKDDLSFYDIRGKFVFESGDFEVEIGSSSKNILFKTREYIDFD